MSVYLSLAHSRRKKKQEKKTICAATAALWYPLCRTEALKWALVWGIHGPPRRLSQILRRPQALLLLFQLLWIPLARQLIGGNNKLGSLQPLANTSLADEEREDLIWSHACGWTCVYVCADAEQHTQVWQWNGYLCHLSKRGPEPLSICL